MKKKVIRLSTLLISGIIGFLLPWLYLVFLFLSCEGSTCGDIGFALQPILLVSLLTCLIGLMLGFLIQYNAWVTLVLAIIPWVFYLFYVLYYYSLPSIQRRGQLGLILFCALLISGIILLNGSIISKFRENG